MRFFSFDLEAKNYASSCEVQTFFAKKLAIYLVQTLGQTYSHILDLGCGNGVLLAMLLDQDIKIQSYTGCDSSSSMLDSFSAPMFFKGKIALLHQDFDICLENAKSYDLICSSSALQWSPCIEHTLQLIAHKSHQVALSIMTSNTLSSFHSFLDSQSPLPCRENMQELLLKFFDGDSLVIQKHLDFQDNKSLIQHLRNTGVMGGGILGYQKAKKILSYQGGLEYESLIFVGQSKFYKGS